MGTSAQAIAEELARLQRGRGLQALDLPARVGPGLAGLLAFAPERGAESRRDLVRQLMRAAQELPLDLRQIFLFACATRPDDAVTLQERLDAVAPRIDRSARVARRRLIAANLAVAEYLLAASAADRAWIMTEFAAVTDLRGERPLSRAQRTLVVTAPSLYWMTELISMPGIDGEAPDLTISGQAELQEFHKVGPSTWEATLRLDRSYEPGETIVYQTELRTSSIRSIDPFLVLAPRRDCWRFTAQAFLGEHAERAWILDGVTAPTALAAEPGGRPVDLAADPSPRVEFEDLTPGLVYGLTWRWKKDQV